MTGKRVIKFCYIVQYSAAISICPFPVFSLTAENLAFFRFICRFFSRIHYCWCLLIEQVQVATLVACPASSLIVRRLAEFAAANLLSGVLVVSAIFFVVLAAIVCFLLMIVAIVMFIVVSCLS